MASENLMMEAVKRGGDRQELHELIRQHSQDAAREVKEHGRPNDLLQRIASDEAFASVHDKIEEITDPRRYVGLSAQQTREFLRMQVRPVLKARRAWLGLSGTVSV